MAGQIDSNLNLQAYIREVSLRDDPILRELRELTSTLPGGLTMQVMAEEGQLLELLVRISGASTILELGTFTGYSTLCMARALPAGGKIITYDITDRWPSIGAEYWQRAGVSDRIEVRIGDATESLAALAVDTPSETFELAFIDADKTLYCEYYEATLALLRPGGLVVIDNTLFLGRVADLAAQDPETVAIRRLNSLLSGDSRVDISLIPMADGITLARKK